jgi:hypothetical protein
MLNKEYKIFKPEKYSTIVKTAKNYRNAANEIFLSDKKKPRRGGFSISQMIINLEIMSLDYTGKIKNHILENIEYLKRIKLFNDKKHLIPTIPSLDRWIKIQLRIINFYLGFPYEKPHTLTEKRCFSIAKTFKNLKVAERLKQKTIKILKRTKTNLSEENHIKREESIIRLELWISATEDDSIDTSLFTKPPDPNLYYSCRAWTSFIEREKWASFREEMEVMDSESLGRLLLTSWETQSHPL